MKIYYAIIVILAVLCIPVLLIISPNALSVQPDVIGNINRFIVMLLFVSLVLERSLDVILTTIREPTLLDYQNRIRECEEKMNWLKVDTDMIPKKKKSETEKLMEQHNAARVHLIRYSTGTKKMFLLSSFVMGICISILGVRIFPNLVSFSGLGVKQIYMINLIDVILTGGVIAGGSKGINSLFVTFTKALNKK